MNRYKKTKKGEKHVAAHIILILGSFIMIFPFIWMILSSFKTVGEINKIPMQFLPSSFNWDNYKIAIDSVPFGAMYFNTIVSIIVKVICACVFSSMAAYAFARIKFPLKNFFFSLVLVQMMVPAQIFIIPQYLMLAKINMLNSIFALVFPGLVSAYGTFLLRQFFMSLPNELEESAVLDGANRWQIYFKIMLPLVRTGLITLAIFTALFAWKNLMWPLIVNIEVSKMTLAAGLSVLKGRFFDEQGVLMAGATIAVVPMFVLYAVAQKQFMEGISQSGLKG